MQDLGYYTPFQCSATAFITITTARAALYGILFNGTGTCLVDGIYSCRSTGSATASTRVSNQIIAYSTAVSTTVNPAVYYPFPAECRNGLVVEIGASADPKVCLFYAVVGGNE